MTQYQRITGKVFGGNATATGNDPQIAQFGSALANTFVGTTDPETIQSLPAWGQGWIGAVTPDTQFPPLPEMTGAMKVLSHQICGILQQGVSTWDIGTIYYTGNFCSKNGIVYVSLTDENQGNDPETDNINWRSYGGADIDLSNLSSQGQNIANWSTNVTNCIAELPQKIKYELNNGVLTFKKGSVVIYPFGVEDLTAQYPKGATFLNDNYKVYDTQFEDGKFFVWVEIQEDRSCGTTQSTINNRTVWFNPQGGVNTGGGDFLFSGTTTPTGDYAVWYDTTRNIITRTTDGGVTWTDYQSFPVAVGAFTRDYGFNSVRVFNGMGYIGSTVWVDKGVKGLIPNGRNEDGTLNNIEVTTNSVLTRTVANNVSVPIMLFLNQTNTGLFIPPISQVVYDEINNILVNNATGERYYSPQLATFDTTNGVVSNFNPKQPFRVADYQDVVKKYNNMVTSINTYRNVGGTTKTATLKLFVDDEGLDQFAFPRCTTMPTTTSSASFSRVAVVVQNYRSGTSWYRVWSDGWKEQGGIVDRGSYQGNGTSTVTLLKAFSNTNYSVLCSLKNADSSGDFLVNAVVNPNSYTATNFKIAFFSANTGDYQRYAVWYACGY